MEPDTEYSDNGNTVRVRLGIRGLMPNSTCCSDITAEASNATIDGPHFNNRGYQVEIKINGQTYRKTEAEIEHAIVPDQCYHEVKKDALLTFLRKANPSQSWQGVIQQGHL
ncbi:uncharacterized protein LOC121375799 isoform X3 [Gigantopelta aegis]|uniref:uncharacterized protein LOC121375799 isoform X3 n=1 Tax=Gigantopelta aegis TaxID=1735272 RepID=UPI001B88AFC3|nr:uncharacterized protein LOC121375799 isoform X3 [Gigantopelta aegis]